MWTIYRKEMLELLRDRKTFIFTILIPIIAVPAIVAAFGYFSNAMFARASRAELPYAVVGAQYAPAAAARFASAAGFRQVALPEHSGSAIRDAIASGAIKFALVIQPGFPDQLARQQQAAIELHYNNATPVDVIRNRVRAVLEQHNETLREQQLAALQLSREQLRFALHPVLLEEHSTADKRERMGALVGGMLPYLLLMGCLMAAMYPAIDLGAGEKERGTLETLLLAPVPRSAIVLAKFLVLFTVGMTSSLLMVGSIGALLAAAAHGAAGFAPRAGGGDMTAMLHAIGAGELAMLMLMLAPSAAIFAALLLSLSIYARSYKEAAGMISPLMLLVLLPVLAALLPGVELNWLWAMVPLTNVALAMKELVKGTMDYSMFAVILLSTTITAGAMLALCSWWFKQEKVLFRN